MNTMRIVRTFMLNSPAVALAVVFTLIAPAIGQGSGEVRFPSEIETGSHPQPGIDNFGHAVAFDGEWALTTERLGSYEPRPRTLLHFFRRESGEFIPAQETMPMTTYPFFGTPGEVLLNGTTAVFSDFLNYDPSIGHGLPRQVFIFELQGNSWSHVQSLEPFQPDFGQDNRQFFGDEISFLGANTIAVMGQIQLGPGATEVAIYVYERTPTGWQGTQVIHAPPYDPAIGGYGNKIGGNESQLVVTNPIGGFYVFERDSQGVWNPAGQGLQPPAYRHNAGENYNGASVDIEGDMLAVGSPMAVSVGFPRTPHVGVVNVFRRIAGVWTWETELKASDGMLNYYPNLFTTFNDQFGISLDIDEGRILVGAYQATIQPGGYGPGEMGEGQGYLFEKINGQWQELYRLRSTQTGQWDQLGWDVALDGDTAILTAPGGTAGTIDRTGRVQIYDLPLGDTICQGMPNSTGQSAELEATGWRHIDMGDLKLTATGLPALQTTLFLAGRQGGVTVIPGGQGFLCIGGPFARFLGSGEFGPSDASGTRILHVPTTSIPINPTVPMLAGEAWVFQAWYRDQNPNSTNNFSSATSVTFE